jgi:hypothetical protein
MWDLATVSADRWRLANRTGGPARNVQVTFRGSLDGRGWFERVTIMPLTLAAGGATEIHILRSDTVGFVEVTWLGPGGEAQQWTRNWTADTGQRRVRTAVLPLDRKTVLPLPYEYDPAEGLFRTLGFVRFGPAMVTTVDHTAADTPAGRDEFLSKVLRLLLVPNRRLPRILRKTQHIG